MKVILSIKPEFVEKIINGEKKFEYRRKIFKKDVEKVIIYASSPIKLVVGEFIIEDILSRKLDELWELTKEESGISKQYFYEYFKGLDNGYAIKIKEFKRYEKPCNLRNLNIFYTPQSFVYI
ncbi:ASCH domain-containing protein [Thermospira aquatica]|uniref:ASCH domain-containing protein n=1 Tax=Thermospira aquatica TaxID=2828656 RepID=A0AAX3BF48_9SPIR|nr:ASCH domain-containing protein [Thermospira aquatica]URA10895.1 ASCH domain-containing protein [Thermospira aquatica]